MANIAFLYVPTLGHVNPMIALAKELMKRGHVATFFHHADFEFLVARHGLPFVRIGEKKTPAGSFDYLLRSIDKVNGLRGMPRVVREFARGTALLCEELPSILRACAIDMIISDMVEPAGGLLARHMGLLHISVAAALPMNWEPGIPSPYMGFAQGASWWHRYREQIIEHGAQLVQQPLREVIAAFAETWRLGPDHSPDHYRSGHAQITQITPSIDYPRQNLSRCFHYCGPLRDAPDSDGERPVRKGTGRAFVTLGSLQGHRVEMFEKIADAALACGLAVTIAHGGRLGAEGIAKLSRKATVHDFVSYRDTLRESDLAIMHGGMNGTLDALAQGVPIVTIPLAFEQPAIAQRLRYAGVGITCSPRASRARLTRAIREVCFNPSYTAKATQIRDEIRAAGGVRRAADIVDHVLRTRRPCFNTDALWSTKSSEEPVAG